MGAPLPSSSASLGAGALMDPPFALPVILPFVAAGVPIGGHRRALAVRRGGRLGAGGLLQFELRDRHRSEPVRLALWRQARLACCSHRSG